MTSTEFKTPNDLVQYKTEYTPVVVPKRNNPEQGFFYRLDSVLNNKVEQFVDYQLNPKVALASSNTLSNTAVPIDFEFSANVQERDLAWEMLLFITVQNNNTTNAATLLSVPTWVKNEIIIGSNAISTRPVGSPCNYLESVL